MMDIEVKLMKCPKCKKEKKLSVFIGEDVRNTWCSKCRSAVIWEVVEEDCHEEARFD